MNKTELIQQTANQTGLSKKDAEQAINAALELMTQALAQGDKIQLVGFGAFETKERRSVAFRPGKALKDAVAL